jgi:hypothetical protein
MVLYPELWTWMDGRDQQQSLAFGVKSSQFFDSDSGEGGGKDHHAVCGFFWNFAFLIISYEIVMDTVQFGS